MASPARSAWLGVKETVPVPPPAYVPGSSPSDWLPNKRNPACPVVAAFMAREKLAVTLAVGSTLRLLPAGVNCTTVGGTAKVNAALEPAAVVTRSAPLVAPAGTTAVTWVGDTAVNVATTPLKLTPVAPLNVVPVMVT